MRPPSLRRPRPPRRAANIYVVYGSGPSARIVTPALTGTLLPGVTRDSLLTLAADLGYSAEEGKISTDEWRDGTESGAITEVFACGTAAVITPIGAVDSDNGAWTVGDGSPGSISMQLREHLIAVQTGRERDVHGWMHRLV
jgi:branched-chain amino acid aminotransferase